MKKYLVILFGSLMVMLFMFVYQTSKFSDKTLRVVFCDVGQGDGIFIRTPAGTDIIIDGGKKNGKMLACLSENMPFWDNKIELLFATHPDADHMGGLVEIIENYEIGSFNTSAGTTDTVLFTNFKKSVRAKKIPTKIITAGDRFILADGVTLETLWPKPDFVSDDTNDYSLVQVLRFGEFQALLTGDVTYQILNTLSLVDSYEVFKLPHHGSKTGVDDASMTNVRAYLAVISVGKNNSYYHPHPSVLSLLKKYSVRYMRTDQLGQIEIITDGRNTKVIN